MKNLKAQLIRLGETNPELRKDLVPIIKAVEARYEKGKPADPTENMSPEDAEKWEEMNERHRDKFKED